MSFHNFLLESNKVRHGFENVKRGINFCGHLYMKTISTNLPSLCLANLIENARYLIPYLFRFKRYQACPITSLSILRQPIYNPRLHLFSQFLRAPSVILSLFGSEELIITSSAFSSLCETIRDLFPQLVTATSENN